MRHGCGIVMLIIITLGFAKEGAAQDSATEARELAKRAIAISSAASGDSQKLAQAIALFEEAFALDPRPQYQCSIGISYQESGKLSLAHLYLGRCIARTSDAKRKAQLSNYQTAIEGELRKQGFVSVDLSSRPSGAALSIAALQEGKRIRTPILLWLGKGAHRIDATVVGHEPAQIQIEVEGGDIVETIEFSPLVKAKVEKPLQVEKPLKVEPETTNKSTDSTDLGDTSTPLAVSSSLPGKRGPSKIRAYAALGVSVLAAGGAVWTYGVATDEQGDIEFGLQNLSYPADEYDDDRSDLVLYERITYGLGVVAIASAALGTYWLLSSGDSSHGKGQLDVALGEGGRGAFVSWSFRK